MSQFGRICRAGLVLAACVAVSESVALADTVYSYGGHTYELVTTSRTWAAAAADAVSRTMYGSPGALVRVDDQAENSQLIGQLLAAIPVGDFSNTMAPDGGGASYVWLGATDRAAEGVWLWDVNNSGSGDQFWQGKANGSSVGGLFNAWGTEPDDYGSYQDAAAICLNQWPKSTGSRGGTGQWNDVDETNQLYYVVEYAAVAPVPEPTTISMLCFGGLACWLLFRRRRR